jgi:drug/metabolite transporter (DMT)-like permease
VLEIPALQMAAIRQFLGGSCFLLFFIGYKKFPLPTLKQFGYILLLATLMFVGANGLSTWSLNYIPTGFSSLIGALYPLSVVIIEAVFYKQNNATSLTFVGMFLGIVGVGFVFYENAFHAHPQGFTFGLILSGTAMLCWSFATVFISRSKLKLNAYYSAGLQMFVGSFLLYIIALFAKQTVPFATISAKAWWAIAYLVIAGSIIAFVAFIYSLKVLPPAISSLYAYINPLVAMVVAYFVVDEKLTWNILWGALITLAGVYLVNYSIKRNDKKALEQNE